MKEIGELLGYESTTKLLIIHADDLGLAHSINLATFAAFDDKAITSASVMVPCPWFAEVVGYAKRNPFCDIGIHLTITAEWKYYKWGPVSTKLEPMGLVDPMGYFCATREDLLQAAPNQVEAEVRTQIELAFRAGLKPSHVDSHMFAMVARPSFAEHYVRVAREHRLLPLIPLGVCRYLEAKLLRSGEDLIRTAVVGADPRTPPSLWLSHYLELVRSLKPGLNQLIVHLGYDDSELQGIMEDQVAYGSTWRQRDFDVVMSADFRHALRDNDVHLISWNTIRSLLIRQNEPA